MPAFLCVFTKDKRAERNAYVNWRMVKQSWRKLARGKGVQKFQS